MARQEVYKSTTMGEIPLSFTGRHLLQSLREATTEMVEDALKRARNGEIFQLQWDPVSRARGKLAQYMSQLERGCIPDVISKDLGGISNDALLSELRKRGYEVNKPAPWSLTREEMEKRHRALEERYTSLRIEIKRLLDDEA